VSVVSEFMSFPTSYKSDDVNEKCLTIKIHT